MSSPQREPSPWVRRLKGVPTDRLAEAETARIDADTARREAERDARKALDAQKRAEAVRTAAEATAAALAQERDEALARVAELEQRLDDAPQPAPVPTPEPLVEPEPGPEPASAVASAVAPAVAATAEPVPVRRSAAPVVLLALADLAAAAYAVYLATQDRLVTIPGVLAMVLTVVLAASLRVADRP